MISCGRKKGSEKNNRTTSKNSNLRTDRAQGEGVKLGIRSYSRELGKGGENRREGERKEQDRMAETAMERARKKGRTKGRKRWERDERARRTEGARAGEGPRVGELLLQPALSLLSTRI